MDLNSILRGYSADLERQDRINPRGQACLTFRQLLDLAQWTGSRTPRRSGLVDRPERPWCVGQTE